MAALPVLTRDKRNGVVFVEDEREDGTLVVLRCTSEAQHPGGVAAESRQPTVWPMGYLERRRELQVKRLTGSDFALTIDTTELPAGILAFDIGRFVERVGEAVDAGEKAVHLDPGLADEWGLVAQEDRDA